jgi:3D (Asp-Asp-Asp) domain-containing protein
LTEAGIPLLELDTSQPAENETLPKDGEIHVTRVSESVVLAQKSIQYESQTIDSPEIALGQQQILKPGQNGLSVSRTRIRYEDGKEVNRVQDVESVVRPPQARVIATGSKIVINTTTVNGVTFQYWRSMKMYATSYSPCRSGVPGQCFNGTKSGLPLQKGIIAVDPSTYDYLVGQKVFIPGYGNAVVGDIGGGNIIEKDLGVPRELWIDLGYTDNNYQEAPGWVTVYFLIPAPATIPAFMK